MSTGFPTNTVVLIITVMIASGTGAWFILSQGLERLPIAQSARRRWRWAVAIVLSAWLLARLGSSIFPPGDAILASQFLITFTSLGLGLLAGILLLLFSPVFRQILRAVPQTWFVGIHAIRITGFLFLALMDMNLLPAEFALSAGYGDMAVGALALGMVYVLEKRKPYARTLLVGWNLLGLLDFISALATGGIYIVPFAAQLTASGVSLSYLNYVLIVPSFGVPIYALLHIYSLYKTTAKRVNESAQEIEEPLRAPAFQR